MNPSDIPQLPLVPVINTTSDTFTKKNAFTRKAYFFERENGTTFHTDAKDAWSILKGRKQHVGFFPERLKLIGVSDGTVYNKAIAESKVIFKEKGIEAAQERLRLGMEEELVEARKHIEMPPDADMVDLQGNPFNFRALQ